MRFYRWPGPAVVLALAFTISGIESQAVESAIAKGDLEFGDVKFDMPKEWKAETRLAVVIAHGVRCPVMRQNYPAFARLMAEYEKRGVGFLFVNGIAQDEASEIEAERSRYKLPFVFRDEQQKLLKELGLKTVGEAVLLEKHDDKWTAQYRGGISDRVNFDRALEKARNEFLKDAIEDRLSGRNVRNRRGSVFGCSITFR